MRTWAGAASKRSLSARGRCAELKDKRRAAPAPSAEAQAQASALAAPIDDEELRQALTKLGARAIDRAGRTR